MARYSQEAAEQVLRENPDLKGSVRTYFEAIVRGTVVDYYLEQFRFRHEQRSDELPAEDARNLIDLSHTGEDSTQYKCQTTHVIGLVLTLRAALKDGVIRNSDLIEEIEGFLAQGEQLHFHFSDPENPTKMDRMNTLVEKVIVQLERSR